MNLQVNDCLNFIKKEYTLIIITLLKEEKAMDKKNLENNEQIEMLIPDFLDCNVIACVAVPAAQAAIALVPAVPSLCWVAAAAA